MTTISPITLYPDCLAYEAQLLSKRIRHAEHAMRDYSTFAKEAIIEGDFDAADEYAEWAAHYAKILYLRSLLQ